MQFDLYLVIGLVIAGFSVPSMVSALSDGHTPRVPAIMVLIGGGLVVIAISQKPGGYTWADIPQAFVRVIGYYIN